MAKCLPTRGILQMPCGKLFAAWHLMERRQKRMKMSSKYGVVTGPRQGFGIYKWVVGLSVIAALYAAIKSTKP